MKIENKIALKQKQKFLQTSLFAIVFSLISISSFSQDFNADFAKIQAFNKNDKIKIKYTSEILMTDGKRDTTMIYTGESVRFKEKYYSKNELTESVSNGDTLIVVDHFNKQMLLYSSVVLDKFLNNPSSTFEKLNVKNDSVALLSDSNGVKNYMIYFREGQILKMNLIIGSDGRVLQTGLYYKGLPDGKAGMKSSVTRYTSYDLNVEKKDFPYTISMYLISKNKELHTLKKYEAYRIKNLLN